MIEPQMITGMGRLSRYSFTAIAVGTPIKKLAMRFKPMEFRSP